MSLILMMAYWIFLPFLVFKAARWLFQRAKNPLGKGLVITATSGLLAWFLWVAVGENMWLDHQVRELCAKDGGVKVYETVTIPAEEYSEYASRNWVLPDKTHAKPSDPYYCDSDIRFYQKGNPRMTRTQHRIIRRSDGKVLGELIRYTRGGGGLPGPWYDSSFMCPAPANRSQQFAPSIFLEGDDR